MRVLVIEAWNRKGRLQAVAGYVQRQQALKRSADRPEVARVHQRRALKGVKVLTRGDPQGVRKYQRRQRLAGVARKARSYRQQQRGWEKVYDKVSKKVDQQHAAYHWDKRRQGGKLSKARQQAWNRHLGKHYDRLANAEDKVIRMGRQYGRAWNTSRGRKAVTHADRGYTVSDKPVWRPRNPIRKALQRSEGLLGRGATHMVRAHGFAAFKKKLSAQVRKSPPRYEDEKLKQGKGIKLPKKVRRAAEIIHKFGLKHGYFPNM